jgi:hypothetical protein
MCSAAATTALPNATAAPSGTNCPDGYGLCTGAGIVPYCARTRWNFESGSPSTANMDFEIASGDGSASGYVSGSAAQVHCGTFSLRIQSGNTNWNTQPNLFVCGATNFGAAMDMRSKTFKMSMFFDTISGSPSSTTFCSFGIFDGSGAEILPLTPFTIVYGKWFDFAQFIPSSTALEQASDINFQCNLGTWNGNLYVDDMSLQ